jgi:hypothetical protein
MTSRELIKRLIARELMERCGSWPGNPHSHHSVASITLYENKTVGKRPDQNSGALIMFAERHALY